MLLVSQDSRAICGERRATRRRSAQARRATRSVTNSKRRARMSAPGRRSVVFGVLTILEPAAAPPRRGARRRRGGVCRRGRDAARGPAVPKALCSREPCDHPSSRVRITERHAVHGAGTKHTRALSATGAAAARAASARPREPAAAKPHALARAGRQPIRRHVRAPNCMLT